MNQVAHLGKNEKPANLKNPKLPKTSCLQNSEILSTRGFIILGSRKIKQSESDRNKRGTTAILWAWLAGQPTLAGRTPPGQTACSRAKGVGTSERSSSLHLCQQQAEKSVRRRPCVRQRNPRGSNIASNRMAAELVMSSLNISYLPRAHPVGAPRNAVIPSRAAPCRGDMGFRIPATPRGNYSNAP